MNQKKKPTHLLAAQQYTPELLLELFRMSLEMEELATRKLRWYQLYRRFKYRKYRLIDILIANIFSEPSTRTRFSFDAAMKLLRGGVVTAENAAISSSSYKNESIADMARVLSGYSSLQIWRHKDPAAAIEAALASLIPLINAGIGGALGQHPTQAGLDGLTIWKHHGRLDNLTVACVGDPKNGRTIRSLAYLLAKYKGNKIIFVSPPQLRVGRDIIEYLKKHGVAYEERPELDEYVLKQADVVYMTRIQKERFDDPAEYDLLKGSYVLTLDFVKLMKPNAIIMHPLPRVGEIAVEVDGDIRAKYFQQAQNGLYFRMAVLLLLLKPELFKHRLLDFEPSMLSQG